MSFRASKVYRGFEKNTPGLLNKLKVAITCIKNIIDYIDACEILRALN